MSGISRRSGDNEQRPVSVVLTERGIEFRILSPWAEWFGPGEEPGTPAPEPAPAHEQERKEL